MTDIDSIAAPWADGRPSIHSLVVKARAKPGAVGEELSLDLPKSAPEQLTWAPGALDSLARRPDDSPRQTPARRLVAAINRAVRRPAKDAAAHLYALLCEQETITTIDEVLSLLRDLLDEQGPALAVLARRLIKEAPDVEPVKAGVALLGISGTADDASLISFIGGTRRSRSTASWRCKICSPTAQSRRSGAWPRPSTAGAGSGPCII